VQLARPRTRTDRNSLYAAFNLTSSCIGSTAGRGSNTTPNLRRRPHIGSKPLSMMLVGSLALGGGPVFTGINEVYQNMKKDVFDNYL